MTARRNPEREYQAMIMDLARRCGWKVWHFHDSRREVRSNGRRKFVGDADAKGFPDLVLVHAGTGRTLFREIKVPPNGLTADQAEALALLAAAGQDAGVWTPADWTNTVIPTLQRRKS